MPVNNEFMDFLRKHVLSPTISPHEFNSHRVNEEFMESCRKAGRLFNKKKERKNE